jgi:hypothetical protein
VTVKTPAPERAAGRKKLAAEGKALPGGEEPIPDVAYLKKAIRSVGRLDPSKRPALKALIIRRAKELNALNAPGVEGTWAFQGSGQNPAVTLSTGSSVASYALSLAGRPYAWTGTNDDGEAINLASTLPRRMPIVRGAADVQMARTAPGVISVMHKSTGMKLGTITPKGAGYGTTHGDGTATPASGSQQGALAGLIRYHNQMAAAKNAKTRDEAQASGAGIAMVKGYAGDQPALDFASAPSVTSGDGPRMTTMGAGKASPAATKLGLSPECAKVYAKLRKKGLDHGAAMSLAKRAAAMHAKAAA